MRQREINRVALIALGELPMKYRPQRQAVEVYCAVKWRTEADKRRRTIQGDREGTISIAMDRWMKGPAKGTSVRIGLNLGKAWIAQEPREARGIAGRRQDRRRFGLRREPGVQTSSAQRIPTRPCNRNFKKDCAHSLRHI